MLIILIRFLSACFFTAEVLKISRCRYGGVAKLQTNFCITAIVCLSALHSGLGFADESTPVFFFGDSDNDTGYFSATTGNCSTWATPYSVCGPITGDGVTTTGSGYHWVNVFGNRFGIATTSVNSSATDTSNNSTTNGGNNYAVTGAFINQVSSSQPGVWSLANQVDRYLLDYGGRADKNAIYSFDVTNDLKFTSDLSASGLTNYIESTGWTSYGSGSTSSGAAGSQSWSGITSYTTLATDYANQAIKLKNAGARYILVEMEVYSGPSTTSASAIASLFDTNSTMSNGFIISDSGYANIVAYNTDVLSKMKAAGVNVIPFDDYATTMYVIENYAQFGFSAYGMSHVACADEVATLTGGWTSASCGYAKHNSTYGSTIYSSDAEAYSAALNEHFFADSSHKAPAFLRIEADVKYNLFAAPVQIGMVSESILQSRRSFHQDLQLQIRESASLERDPNERLNFWILTEGEIQLYDLHKTGFSDIGGEQLSGTIGVDYGLDNGAIIGSSVGSFIRDIDFSGDRGGYTQNEYVVSVYAAFNETNYWSNVSMSYGYIQNDVDRKAPMGITTQTISGDVDAQNFSVNLATGYDFKHTIFERPFGHGPVLGLTYQEITREGFTESSTVSVLALAFEKYRVTSLEGELGYQGQIDMGSFMPFAVASIRHEFDEVENRVGAAITSSTNYNQTFYIYMPEKSVDYGSLKLGSKFNLQDDLDASVYVESAFSGSERIYQNLSANLNFRF